MNGANRLLVLLDTWMHVGAGARGTETASTLWQARLADTRTGARLGHLEPNLKATCTIGELSEP